MIKNIAIVLLVTATWAQSAGKPKDLKLDASVSPPKPFSAKVPDGLAWQVKVHSKQKAQASTAATPKEENESDEPDKEDPAAARMERYRALMQQGTVVEFRAAYAKGLREETVRFGGGREVERFQKSGFVAYKDWQTGAVSVDTDGMSASGPLWGIGTFNELAWITKDHYAGVGEFNGRLCYVYRQYPATIVPDRAESDDKFSGSRAEESLKREGAAGIPASKTGKDPVASPTLTAFIDAETMLPVALQKPDETWIYKILGTSATPQLPENIAAALQERDKAFEDMGNKYRAGP